jgi:hypothetical protein
MIKMLRRINLLPLIFAVTGGVAIAQVLPVVSVSPTSLTFSSQVTGSVSATRTIVIKNSGLGTLRISAILITGAHAAEFSSTNDCTASIDRNGACTVSIKFSPSLTGSRSATLEIRSNTATKTVSLRGTGAAPPQPTLTLTPTSVTFSSQSVGTTSAATTVNIKNTGAGLLQISSISVSGAHASDFTSTNTCGAAIAKDGTCAISVTFKPTATGSRTASIEIKSSATLAKVSLTGTGGESATLVISEISNCYYPNLPCWFEIHNRSNVAIGLGDYRIRSTSAQRKGGGFLDVREFLLPSTLIKPGQYVIVSGNVAGNIQRGEENLLVSNDERVPYWSDTYGFIEITRFNKTVDFVLLGGRHSPVTTDQWAGLDLNASEINSEEGYGKSLVRPFASISDTDSAADWIAVNWITPGGRNDVPASATDFDNDGVPDSAEVMGGTYAGMDLFAIGARPDQKDIFVEVDFMEGDAAGLIPKKEALQKVVDAFATRRIRLHFDAGPAFSQSPSALEFNLGQGGAVVPYEKCVVVSDTSVCNQNISGRRVLFDWKYQFMELRRRAIFHYMLFGNSMLATGAGGGNGGQGELFGNDTVITLGSSSLKDIPGYQRNLLINYQATVIMHELGHNLGLSHGGNEELNDKPNYLSVMNYTYTYPGLDPSPSSGSAYLRWRHGKGDKTPDLCSLVAGPCGDPAQFQISFSDGLSASLNEEKLLEKDNVGRGSSGGGYADWNMDGALTATELAIDLNSDGKKTVLKDHDDWGNLWLAFSRRTEGISSIPGTLSKTERPMRPRLDPISDDYQQVTICEPFERRVFTR